MLYTWVLFTPSSLTKLLEDNYYSLRDNAYQTWDDNTIRNWLEKKGYVKTPVQAKRDE